MGVVNTTYTFKGTDTITSSNLNNIIDDTTFTGTAISGSTLQVTGGGQLAVASGGITSNELASNAVVTSKILDANVTTAKIADANVTVAKLESTLDLSGKTVTLADSSITPAKLTQKITTGTAVALSGSSVTFGSIPSWVQQMTFMFDGVSSNGTQAIYVRIGSGGTLQTTGYDHRLGFVDTNMGSSTVFSDTVGFEIMSTNASAVRTGSITFVKLGASNTWIGTGVHYRVVSGVATAVGTHVGKVSLSGDMDIIGITCGTNTFDAGTVNVFYQ